MAERFPESVDLRDYLEEEEMDAVRAAIAYMLIKNTDLDREAVYSIVFEEGRKITWH